MGKIVALANQKGGVGKTTTTINLGATLAQNGCSVLLVDLDPQSNTTSGVGISTDLPGSYEVLIGSVDVQDVIVQTEVEGLFIVPSRMDLTAAEIELVPVTDRELLLKSQLIKVKDVYDFILIDCPPSLGILTVNALTAADSVLIPLQCEYYAMEGLGQLTNTIGLIRQGLNQSLKLEGILLTMYDMRNNLSKEVLRQINEYFPDEVYETVIPRNVRLSEAPSYGKPITLYDNTSVGAERYTQLALEVISRNS